MTTTRIDQDDNAKHDPVALYSLTIHGNGRSMQVYGHATLNVMDEFALAYAAKLDIGESVTITRVDPASL